MPKYSFLFCLSLLVCGNSASPYKSGRMKVDSASSHQDTSRSYDFNEKILLGNKETESLEDMDLTEADTDPSMVIWKAVKQSRQERYKKAEEGEDGLYHPSEIQLTAGNKQPDAYFQPQYYGRVWVHERAEKDNLYHNTHGVQDQGEPEKVTGELLEPLRSPEEDQDDMYHRDLPRLGSDLKALEMQALIIRPKTVYTEPEEDLDGLYHS